MEALVIILLFGLVLVLVLPLILSIVALVQLSAVRNELETVRAQLRQQQASWNQGSQQRAARSPEAPVAVVAQLQEQPAATVPSSEPLPVEPSAEASAFERSAQEQAPVEAVSDDADSPSHSEEPPVLGLLSPSVQTEAQPPSSSEHAPAIESPGLEERIGTVWLTRIGAAVFVLGAAYFFKYAVDNNWIGPWGRVAIGALLGMLVLVFAETMRERLAKPFVTGLLGFGLALLYLSSFATYGFYRLVPVMAAFSVSVIVAMIGAAFAIRHRSSVILVMALGAAFANPILLSTGTDQPLELFAYLLTVSVAGMWAAYQIGSWSAVGTVVLGEHVLFLMWLGAHFKTHPGVVDSLTGHVLEGSAGAYQDLSTRIAPMLFVVLSAVLWSVTAHRFLGNRRSAWNWLLITLPSFASGHLAMGALLFDRPAELAAAMAAGGLVSVLVALKIRETRALVIPLLASFVLLGSCDASATLIVLIGFALWALVYWCGALVALFKVDKRDSFPVLIATASSIAFVGLVLIHTSSSDDGLRAVLSGIASATAFVPGLVLHQREPERRAVGRVLLGAGLALLGLAVGLAFSGVTLALLWALLGAVLSLLAVEKSERFWLVSGLSFLFAAIIHVLGVDVPAPDHARELFFETLGREGALAVTPVLNQRFAAIVGTSAALLLTAYQVATRWRLDEPGVKKWLSSLVAIVGYCLILGILIGDVSTWVTDLPTSPLVGDPEAFQRFIPQFYDEILHQANQRSLSATLVLGVFGGVLLTAGFVARSVLHRWLGIVVLFGTLCKLGLYDIWELPRIFQVAALVAVGGILLGSGFLYARYGKRLIGLLTSGLLLTFFLSTSTAQAADIERFEKVATFDAAQPGLVSFEVSPELYRASKTGSSLHDLRVLSSDGGELPWFLRDRKADQPPREIPAEMIDRGRLSDGSFRTTFDLATVDARHSALRLELAGDEFMNRCVVEVSSDNASWVRVGGGFVYRVPSMPNHDEPSEVRYSVSSMRYVRLTVLATKAWPTPSIRGGKVLLRVPDAEVPTVAVNLPIVERGREPKGKRSFVVVDAAGENVLWRSLVLQVRDLAFERRVEVQATSRLDAAFQPASVGMIYRAGNEENLRLRAGTSHRYLRVVVEDGDDAPLNLEAVQGVFVVQDIVTQVPSMGKYRVFIGNEAAQAPVHDLARVVERNPDAVVSSTVLSAPEPNPAWKAVAPQPLPWTERHRVWIGAILAGMLLGLGLWVFRLVRTAPQA